MRAHIRFWPAGWRVAFLFARRHWLGWLALSLSLVLVACGGSKNSSSSSTSSTITSTPTGTISLFAGSVGLFGDLDGMAVAASRFSEPAAVTADSSGSLYVADSGNSTIRMIDKTGKVTTLAGLAGATGSNDGVGSSARFSLPQGIAVDPGSSPSQVVLYVADTGNDTIRKVSVAISGGNATATVSTVAGAVGVANFADGTGAAAHFSQPFAVAVDGSGQVYVADTGNDLVRKVNPGSGQVSLFAGSALQTTVVQTSNSAAAPVTTTAVTTTSNNPVAGSSSSTAAGVTTTTTISYGGAQGFADGTAGQGRFNQPKGLVFVNGTLYVADTGNNAIRSVDSSGKLLTVVGGGGSLMDGASGALDTAQAPNGLARFNSPTGLTVDNAGNLYVADTGNDVIRKIDGKSFAVTTFAGQVNPLVAEYFVTSSTQAYQLATSGGLVDPAKSSSKKVAVGSPVVFKASSFNPVTLGPVDSVESAPDAAGTVQYTETSIVASVVANSVGTIDPAAVKYNVVSTVKTFTRDTTNVVTLVKTDNSTQTLTSVPFSLLPPSGLPLDSQPTLSSSSTSESFLEFSLQITSTQLTPPMPNPGSTDGYSLASLGTVAQFHSPSGLVMLPGGVLYVADTDNQTIRQINTSSMVTTWAGAPAQQGSNDNNGVGAQAQLYNPAGIVFFTAAAASYAFVADSSNNTIRAITRTVNADGSISYMVSTIAGVAGTAGWKDGTGSGAEFHTPMGIALDSSGSTPVMYVSDANNDIIRKLVPSDSTHLEKAWTVSTFAGNTSSLGGSTSLPVPGLVDSADGSGVAQFNYPTGIAVYKGSVYVADTLNHAIRKISPLGVVTTIAGSYDSSFHGAAGATIGGNALSARFTRPAGIAVDGNGNIFITESGNDTVRELTLNNGILYAYAVAGMAGTPGNTDGLGSTASFNAPNGIVVVPDKSGNAQYLYVADSGNYTIRKIDLTNTVTANAVSTVVGNTGKPGFQPGATPGYINAPVGLALDLTNAAAQGPDLYISMGDAVVKVQNLP